MLIFKYKQNKLEGDLKIRLYGIRLFSPDGVKYPGDKNDVNLSWQCQVNDLFIMLNRANTLLFKTRKYVSPKILRSIYFRIQLILLLSFLSSEL